MMLKWELCVLPAIGSYTFQDLIQGEEELVCYLKTILISTPQCVTPFSHLNRPRSIYQYSNMAPRLSGQLSIFGVVFFVSKSLLGIEGQKKLEKFAILTRKPRSHARILIYRTWPIHGCPSQKPPVY